MFNTVYFLIQYNIIEQLRDSVTTHDQLGSGGHYEIHFNIKVKSESTNKKQCMRNAKELIIPTYKELERPHLECCTQAR